MNALPIGDAVGEVRNWLPQRDEREGTFTYIDLSAIDQELKAILGARTIATADAPSRARQVVRAGDVLVSTVRPNLNAVATVTAELDGATASTGFCVLRPRPEKLDTRYLYHWVRTPHFVADMVRQATGANYPAVSDRIVLESKIPWPSLSEQRRIAEILDKADELRAKRLAALAQLDTLTHSIFLDLFGDPVANPRRFQRAALGQIIEFIGGSQPPKETFTHEGSEDTVRLVQIRDFKSDKFRTYIPRRLARRVFEKDDVMIGRYGPPLFQILRGLSGSYNVALIKAAPRSTVTKDFVFGLLREPQLQAFVIARSERTAGQTGVNLELLENYQAYVPPMSVQLEYSRRVHSQSVLRETCAESARQLDALFATLQHRAFVGEL